MRNVDGFGFEIIPQVFDRERISTLLNSIDYSGVARSRAGIRHALAIDFVRSLANETALLGIASDVLGGDAVPFRATLFDKSPRSNWLVVWHQDTALPLCERLDAPGWGPWSLKEGVVYAHAPQSALEQILAIRVHLDDSHEHNGSLRVLPESHTLGVLTDDAIQDWVRRIPCVECHVNAGGILLMRPLLIHSSSKVHSHSIPRRVLHIEYASRTSFPNNIRLRIC
jgi:ectoine hydroxylase-related dioxygenase (phytanoyl-CoA dioxygenase family)